MKCDGLPYPAAVRYGWVNNPEQIKIQGPVRGEAAFFAVLKAIIDDRLQRCDALVPDHAFREKRARQHQQGRTQRTGGSCGCAGSNLARKLKEIPMTKAFDSIKQGLNEAIAHAKSKGKTTGITLYQPQAVDVSGLRQRLSLTQEHFAARFGFSVATLRHWERGDRAPSGASLVLLNVIDRNPGAVLEALQP